jgi:succinate-semialdehyde dehydrogenase/glutarate-semialdehyde dehydrogenase
MNHTSTDLNTAHPLNPLDLLLDSSLLRTHLFINGQWVDEATNHFDVHDPATSYRIAQVVDASAEQTECAIQAAHSAWHSWRQTTSQHRAKLLLRWFELLQHHASDLALIITSEQGKPLAEAEGEVKYAASFIEWFAEEAKRIYGETIPSTDPLKRLMVIKQSIGVCAAITPWNFPLAMITRKVAPALAAGCTVVLKPAEQTPLTALACAELAARAGFPPGVLNVITASRIQSPMVGQVLSASPIVRHMSFTGSTEVGRILMQQCAPTIKKLSLELGGNAPFLVFDDADLDQAVEGAIRSKYRNAGQTCVCTNRFLVQASIYEAFAQKLATKAQSLCVGSGFHPNNTIGPLINDEAMTKVQAHVADAVAHGAHVITGGKVLGPRLYAPTVLTNVTPQMRCTQEETFGPVAPLMRFDSEQDAITLANNTEYGLASYIFSRDISRIYRVAEALEYGMVGINTGLISATEAPFGGIKQSGLGREGSRYGLDEYLALKYLCLGMDTPS